MINSLLRSGCPDDFLTLGENGQAVFDSAWQIRETLRLRNQQAIADALAIPQINDSGSRIDWYAPNPGQVTSWAAASEEQRVSALRYLEHCQTNLKLLSSQCLRSEKTALQLFGSLLTKVLQFPASQYIYLINDKPVITFWGFINQNETIRENSLSCLQAQSPLEPLTVATSRVIEPPVVNETVSEKVSDPAYSQIPDLTIYSADTEPTTEPVIAPVEKITPRSYRRWLSAAGILALLLALAGGSYLIPRLQSEEETEVASDLSKPQVTESVEQKPVPVAEIPASTLPLILATVIPPVVVEIPVPEAPSQPITKGALVLPADELKMGSTKFLNGSWQVRIQFSDPIAGKPPTLRYRISNNKGTVRLSNSDNVTCSAQVYSGLHQSGVLMIKSRGNARCDDGTRHVLPEISCKAGINGVAECTGRYEGDNQVPVTFQKVSN
ncbi:DNA segregation ATPase FtsK/SpoIIIE-like protein [Klebsiella sp. BIGb0407]|nr:DNA segregation ATPase FtsK/SpoIIIE-like protein [Klebsiella sp. BIGb0407]